MKSRVYVNYANNAFDWSRVPESNPLHSKEEVVLATFKVLPLVHELSSLDPEGFDAFGECAVGIEDDV